MSDDRKEVDKFEMAKKLEELSVELGYASDSMRNHLEGAVAPGQVGSPNWEAIFMKALAILTQLVPLVFTKKQTDAA